MIAGYLKKPGPERVTKGEQLCELLRELAEDKKPVKKDDNKTEVYETTRDYDPVLQSHCRLGRVKGPGHD
jgi:hypothetical protein